MSEDNSNQINRNILRLRQLRRLRGSVAANSAKLKEATGLLITETAALDTHPTLAARYLTERYG